jgi:diaminohydroxyphosphoribosylaminopyrimidine deaminase/5-amino-6-(5-phosphoribosylamino)uracil reductase
VVDARLMGRAIELAQEWPHTHPNPRVGAVVVDRAGVIVGEGWHRGPGTDHAEIAALAEAGEAATGSTVYVSLEPCSHHGRTPPCANALMRAGVSTVVVGTLDPDARVAGQGVQQLRDGGIEVITGIEEQSARAVDPAYFHHRETGMPLVTIKWAMTLDGAVAASDGSSRWITGETARHAVHELRSRVDAVVVGSGTLRMDDPGLDVRFEGYEGPQPRPVIVSGGGGLPETAQIWSRDPIVVSTDERSIPSGELLRVPGDGHRPDPHATCKSLADLGLLQLLVEGGPTLAGAWWRAGVVDEGFVHIGARIGGGSGATPMAGAFATIGDADDVEFQSLRNVGDDIVIAFTKRR